ncbi:MAG: OmpA family protein [Pseudomonadota bacterium]|nr:OmpA family protein [Pseudomonadota bacterium]
MFAPLVSQAFESEESYVGLGLGFSRLTPGTSDSVYDNVDESGFGFQLFGGYRLKDDISVELHYTDLGNAVLEDGDTGEESDFGYSALGAALHWYPWQTSWNGKNSLNAYLEAGLASISTDSDVDYSKEASMALGLGIGIEYSFKDSWAARISGQSFTRDAHFVGLSIMKRFGTTEPVPQRRPVVKPRPLPKPEPVKAPVVIMADSDDDGIVDDIDDCPGTPSGMSVNHRGCSVLDARLDGVYFASGSAELTRGATRTLEQVADTLMEYPDARIEIGAYTDSLGAAANNQRLSERRANAVMQYLIDMGINPMRLEARGYGEEDPIASNDTAQGRAANRRVEIRVIK